MTNNPKRTRHADLAAVKVERSFGNHVSAFLRESYGMLIVTCYLKLTGSIASTDEANRSVALQ